MLFEQDWEIFVAYFEELTYKETIKLIRKLSKSKNDLNPLQLYREDLDLENMRL